MIDFDITESSFDGKRIMVLPTWMLPRVQMQFDCFINTASFQEMEVINQLATKKNIVIILVAFSVI